jgi:hypothetical protein
VCRYAAANAMLFDDDAFTDSAAEAEMDGAAALGRLVDEAEAGLERKVTAGAREANDRHAGGARRASSTAALAASALPEAAAVADLARSAARELLDGAVGHLVGVVNLTNYTNVS